MADKNFNGYTSPYVRNLSDGKSHVTYFLDYNEAGLHGTGIDGFGRKRVSQPETLFDSAFINGGDDAKQALIWDELIVNNSGNASSLMPRLFYTLNKTMKSLDRQK